MPSSTITQLILTLLQIRWVRSTEISSILGSILGSEPNNIKLFLKIDNSIYEINFPELSDIKSLIETRLENVQKELAPLKQIDLSITNKAKFYSRSIIWIGFLYLVTQTLVM